MPAYNSIIPYTGDGVRTRWEINFSGGFIDPSHIFVVIGSIATQAVVEDGSAVIEPAIANGTRFSIERRTPANSPLVDYAAGADFSEDNLDTTAKQSVFVAAESGDALSELRSRALAVPAGSTALEVADLSDAGGKVLAVIDGKISPITSDPAFAEDAAQRAEVSRAAAAAERATAVAAAGEAVAAKAVSESSAQIAEAAMAEALDAGDQVRKASWSELSVLTTEPDGRVGVSLASSGTHAALTGDVGVVEGQTPNGGQFRYTVGVGWVRIGDLESAAAKAWAGVAGASALDAILSTGAPAITPNLFDANRATDGQFINTDGSIGSTAGYTLSSPIRIPASGSLVFARAITHRRFLNSAGGYLAGSYGGAHAANTPLAIPAGASFIQFDQVTGPLNSSRQMLVIGTALPAQYRAAGSIDPQSARRAAILQSRRTIRSMAPGTENLFDKSRAVMNTALNTLGTTYTIAGWYTTPKIETDPGVTYVSNKSSSGNGASQYDEDGVFLRAFTIIAGTSFVCPDDCYFVAQQANGLANADTMMFAAASTVPAAYVAFQSPATLATAVTAAQAGMATMDARLSTRRNLFDARTALDNTALSDVNGAQYPAMGRVSSPIMAVTPGADVYVTTFGTTQGAIRVIWRTSTGAFVSSGSVADGALTTPAGAYGMQIDCPHYRFKESVMVSVGSAKPSGYRPFVTTGNRPKQDAQAILLGDSFTDIVATAGGWTPYFVNETGASIIANHGLAGRATRDAVKTRGGVALVAADFANATDVLIALGTNDYGGNRPRGTIADASDGYAGPGSFYNDVYMVLKTLYGFKPDLRIAWATPTIRGNFVTTPAQPFYPAANSVGATLQQYRDAIIEVCALFGTPVIDMFRISGFNLANIGTVTDDLLHPNMAVGNPRYGRAMGRAWNAV